MGMTRGYQETIRARVAREPAFRDALLAEAVDSLIAGEVGVGKALLRDFVDATIGFDKLSVALGSSARSLKRMLSASSNPAAASLFAMIGEVRRSTGAKLEVTPGLEAGHRGASHAHPLPASAEPY